MYDYDRTQTKTAKRPWPGFTRTMGRLGGPHPAGFIVTKDGRRFEGEVGVEYVAKEHKQGKVLYLPKDKRGRYKRWMDADDIMAAVHAKVIAPYGAYLSTDLHLALSRILKKHGVKVRLQNKSRGDRHVFEQQSPIAEDTLYDIASDMAEQFPDFEMEATPESFGIRFQLWEQW